MKVYTEFPKSLRLESRHQMVNCHIQDTRWVGVLPLCRDAVGIFYSPRKRGIKLVKNAVFAKS